MSDEVQEESFFPIVVVIMAALVGFFLVIDLGPDFEVHAKARQREGTVTVWHDPGVVSPELSEWADDLSVIYSPVITSSNPFSIPGTPGGLGLY